ncbi:hypothetical protein EYS14_11280 [Alteromonadaceae bacterium M269]|nr:hypothetical protein EYS14_11280 [Alteromonadaceae bacterium M269]
MTKVKSQYHKAELALVEFYKRKKLPSIGAFWDDHVWLNPIPSAPNIIFLRPNIKRKAISVAHIKQNQFPDSYGETLRAYIAFKLEHNGERAASISPEMQILRKFTQYMCDRNKLFCELDTPLYENYIQGITGTGNAPYANTRLLNNFLKFLQEHGAVNKLIKFRNPNRFFSSGQYSYVGSAKSNTKIASEDTLLAAAEAFNFLVPAEPSTCSIYSGHLNAICAAFFPILMGAPDRINELAILEKQQLEAHFDHHNNHAGWTLNWRGSKGKEDFKKPFLDVLYIPLKRALDFLIRVGEPARVMARYYEDQSRPLVDILADFSPDSISNVTASEMDKPVSDIWRLGSILGIFRNCPIPETLKEMAGFPDNIDVSKVINDRNTRAHLFGLPRFNKSCPAFLYSENRIEHLQRAWIEYVQKQIVTFPYRENPNGKKVHLSNAMITLLGIQIHGTNNFSGKRTYPGSLSWFAIEPVNYITAFKKRLSGTSATKSFFQLAGFREDMNLRSHQIRHFLNTIMQQAGMSERMIATWSGRATVSQNAVYDHRTDEEKVCRIAEVQREIDTPIIVIPVNDLEFKKKTGVAAAKQDTGYCIQNLDINPCIRLTNCIGCSSNCVVKGDNTDSDFIEINRDLALHRIQTLVKKASDLTVHEKWMQTLIKRYQAHEALLIALRDSRIEEGSVIRFVNDDEPTLRITDPETTEYIEYKPNIPPLPKTETTKNANADGFNPLEKLENYLDQLQSNSHNKSSVSKLIEFKNIGLE